MIDTDSRGVSRLITSGFTIFIMSVVERNTDGLFRGTNIDLTQAYRENPRTL